MRSATRSTRPRAISSRFASATFLPIRFGMVTSRLWMANRIAVIALKNAAEARMNTSRDIRISHSSRSRIVIQILSAPDYHAPQQCGNNAVVLLMTASRTRGNHVVADQHSHAKLEVMEVTLHIPDDIAKRLSAAGGDVSRRALEAVALEGYREQTLTLYQVSEMLGLSRVQIEECLGQHRVPLAVIDEANLHREAALFEAASRR